MRIVTLKSDLWAAVARDCAFATFFHHPDWYAVLADVFPDWSCVAVTGQDGRTGAHVVLPLVAMDLSRTSASVSLHAGGLFTYGGPLGEPHVDGHALSAFAANAVTWAKLRAGAAALYGNPLRDLPTPPGFTRGTLETHVVEFRNGMQGVRHGYSEMQRRGLRACEKFGVTVRLATRPNVWGEYFRCYQDSLARWGARTTSRYPWELFERLSREPADRVALWVAEAEGRLMSGVVLGILGGRVYYWHGAMSADAAKMMPSRKLWDVVLESYCNAGFLSVDLLPSGGHEGVVRFKESLGARARTIHTASWQAGAVRSVAFKVARTLGMPGRALQLE